MIRKPDARDFRESTTVSALRDAKTLAVEGGRGIGQGTAGLLKWWLIGMMGFAFAMSVAAHVGAVGTLTVLGGGVAWYLSRRKKAALRAAAAPTRVAPRHVVHPEDEAISGTYDLSVGVAGRRAARFAVPAILLFPTSGLAGIMAPLMLLGIVLFALAVLTVARVFGDRTIVRYDARALTVRGLLGEATILWDDVDDIRIRKAPLYDLPTLFTSGSRRNIVVTASVNRLGGPTELFIPHPLLGTDREQLHELLGILLSLQSHAPITVIDALKRQRSSAPMAAPQEVAAMPFDPDAIIARHMAERNQMAATVRPDLAAGTSRPTFGRKLAR